MDPVTIGLYVDLLVKGYDVLDGLVSRLRQDGATDEQLAAITLDYDARIARRQAEQGDQG